MKWLQTETNEQIVFKAAVHRTEYVTKVMKRLSDQSVDPKVVPEFVLSLYYYSSYDYCLLTITQLLNGCCLHPCPPSKQAKLPQNEAKTKETR